MLDSILEKLRELKYPIYLNSSPKIHDCIVYKYIPLLDDGCIAVSRLELRVISKKYSKSCEIDKQIRKILLSKGDKSFIEKLLNAEIIGGAYIFDDSTQTHQIVVNVQIKNRSEVKIYE